LLEDLDMGFVHRLVQEHIVYSYGSGYLTEVSLIDGKDRYRADIVDKPTGLVWEVKHAGKNPEYRIFVAQLQANNYVGKSGPRATITGLGAAGVFEGHFYIGCEGNYYLVSYTTPAAGVVLYSIQEVDSCSEELFRVYVPKSKREQTQAVQYFGMFGAFIGGGGKFRSAEDIASELAYTY
jgi:hypothetical protein